MTESVAELRHALSAKTLSRLGGEKANAGSWAKQCVRYSVLRSPQGKDSTAALCFLFLFSVVCYVTSTCQSAEG